MGHYTLGISTMKTIIFFTFVVIPLKLVIANPLDITDRNAIKSKCDDKELKEASDNYEECQQMIFTTMKDMRAKENQGNDVIKKSTNSDEKQILTILEATLSDGDNALCQALDKFINCTTILGWCFTDEHVQATMKEQREVSRSALAKMEVYCPETEDITITTTTTSIPTPTSQAESQLFELPRSAPSHSNHDDHEPESEAEGAATSIGYSFTIFVIAIVTHLLLYK